MTDISTGNTPHMTLVSPASGNDNTQMKDRMKRRDQKLRRLLFGNDSTLQRQRSIVIKELMMGHDHKGCLMTSHPVQKELKKLLRKTMQLKAKGKSKKATSVVKLLRWVTRRKRSGSTCLLSNSDLSSVNMMYTRGKTRSPASSGDPGTSSDYYLTPRPLTPSRPTPRQLRRSTPPSRSYLRSNSCRQRSGGDYPYEDERTPLGNSSRRNGRRQVTGKISRRRNEISQSFRDMASVSPEEYFTIRKSLRRIQKLNRSAVKHEKALKSILKRKLFRHFSERQHHPTPLGSSYSHRRRRSSSLSPSRSLIEPDDIDHHPHHRGHGSPRPASRLERLQRAWREEDIYSLNPFDSWRLRHHPSRYSPPPHPPRDRVSPDCRWGRQNGPSQHNAFSVDQMPIRRRLRKSWRQERDASSPPPRRRSLTPPLHQDLDTGSSQLTPESRSSHLLPQPSDVFFRPRPPNDAFSPPHLPGPLHSSQAEASPFVLGWLQVPQNTAEPVKNRVFRKAPWLRGLQFLHR